MADVLSSKQQAYPSGNARAPQRYPNLLYHTVAIMCVILLVVEVAGHLKGDGTKIAILVGMALLALLAPNIENLTIGKGGIVAILKNQIEENSSKLDETKKDARELDAQLDQSIAQIFVELRTLKSMISAFALPPDRSDDQGSDQCARAIELPEVTNKDDPQKGRFGESESSNGRVITAVVEPSSLNNDWCKIDLSVRSAPGAPALSGAVQFFLHNTFSPDRYVIQASNGEAVLVLRAWGAFTVGAVADEGRTRLELDLATSPNVQAPEHWRKR